MEKLRATDSFSNGELQGGVFTDTQMVISVRQSLAVDTGLLEQSAASSDRQLLERWASRRSLCRYLNDHQHATISSSRYWASWVVSSLKQRTAVSPLASFPHLAINHQSSTSMGVVNTVMHAADRPERNGIEMEQIYTGSVEIMEWQTANLAFHFDRTETSPFLCLLL